MFLDTVSKGYPIDFSLLINLSKYMTTTDRQIVSMTLELEVLPYFEATYYPSSKKDSVEGTESDIL
jgi:hypothetical protein